MTSCHQCLEFNQNAKSYASFESSSQVRSGPPLLSKLKKLRALFAKVRGDDLHKLKYYNHNQGPAVTVIYSCLIRKHLELFSLIS